jgi:GNAT superfamily N-acetyltransferase
MDSLIVNGDRFDLSRADVGDVPALVALLSDDVLGAARESRDMAPYVSAFHEIDDDDHQFLLAVRAGTVGIVGTMQLTIVPGLSRGGLSRLQIEAVRLAASTRGSGLGSALFDWAHDYGRRRGATLAQLTSDKTRSEAHRFYAKLGYEASHEGFKRRL